MKYIIIFLLAAFTFSSCNNMDNEPTNSYTDANFWTSIDKAQYMLNMAYNQLYNSGKMWNDERLSDNVFQGRGFTDQRIIRNGIAEPATGIFAGEWQDLYSGIKTCNVFLEHIDQLQASDAVKDNMKAQARFIRASLFFRLTNFYGDIPFFTKDITLDEANTISRTPRATVVDFIHQELDDIVKYLPTRNQLSVAEKGKITKGAALMLQARVYLYDGNWANVEKYCMQIMDGSNGTYALFPSYTGLFQAENEYNSEVIMDCAYVPSTRTWSDLLDMVPLSKGGRVISTAPTQSLVDSYITLDGESIKNSSTYNENNPYVNRDPRLTGTIIYDGYDWSGNIKDGTTGEFIYSNPAKNTADAFKGLTANSSPTGYYVRKYYDVNHEAGMASGINIITMRYADVLLMYAESMNEQGKMSLEVWNKTVKPIRERAGFTKATALAYPSALTTDEMRQTLRVERRSELALEGLRWFDIKRWKAGEEYLNGYMYGAKFGQNNSYIQLDKYQFVKERDYLWSLPQSQMDINPNLKPNNPGYAN